MRFIALLGNPNSGKTTLFNELTGAKQHVGNWPGVTVEKKEGKLKKHKNDVTIVDLPGIYSLSPYTLEEVVSRDYIIKEKPSAIINIVDATNLERNLYLTTQAIETGVPVVIALNMMDLIEKRGLKVDVDKLSRALGGVPVVPISALESQGLDKLVEEALKLNQVKANTSVLNYGESVEKVISEIEGIVGLTGDEMRYHAIKLIENDKRVQEDLKLSPEVVKKVEAIVSDLEDEMDNDGETIITNSRYDFIGSFMPQVMTRPKTKENLTRTDKIDAVVTNRFLALPIFALVMFVVYYIAITAVGGPSQDWVGEYLIDPVSEWTTDILTDAGASEWVIDMLVNGAIAGVGAVLTFVPQLMLLYFFLSFLEGCGYMSRIAFIMDRIFRRFGLSGKSFIPFLMATGCAVPSILATRTIENDNDRRMTVVLTSFMPCGAKLPVVAMLAAAALPENPFIAPSMYLVAIVAIILSGIILKHTPLFSGDPAPFIIELPEYRMPKFKNVLLMMWEKAKTFVKKAGTIIFASSVIIWLLSSHNFSFELVEDVGDSMMATLGGVIAPIFKPLGFGTWQATAGAIAGLVAKENLVATLAILYGLGEGFEEGTEPELVQAIQAAFTPAAAMAYLLFNLFCIPCIAAMGAIKREMMSWKWTLFAFFYQCAFAYVIALLVYQIGSRLF